MADLYENLIAGSPSKLLSIVISIVIITITYVISRQIKRLFSWLRAKKLPPQIIDIIEPPVRQLIKFAGILLFLLDVSSIFGILSRSS